MTRLASFVVGFAVAGALALQPGSEPARATGPAEAPLRGVVRRPINLALTGDGKWLFVANERSGSVSVIDTASLAVVREVPVGRKLSDLALTANGHHLLVLDEEAGELVSFARSGSRLEEPVRVQVSPFPVSVRISADGARGTVASLWSRRLTVVELPPAASDRLARPRVHKTIDLPFAPRLHLHLPGSHKAIVADSFAGRLAVVDLDRGALESDRALPAHNIRGLAVSDDGTRLLVSHLMLSSRATTSRDDIHWGNLISGGVRALNLAHVLDAKAELLRDSRLYRLGDVGRGAGDPAGVAAAPGGKVVVALAGVGEVAVRGAEGGAWQRLAVGRRPTAVALDHKARRGYIANTLSDTVSVLDLEANQVRAEVPLGPAPQLGLAERGELLFYDARRSHDGWFSCHSCHTDGHSNGLLADTLGDGSHGTPRRVLSLLGVGDTGPWAWNGGMAELRAQLRKSADTTMQGPPLTAEQEQELSAYLRTLAPPPSRASLGGSVDAAAVRRGRDVFTRQGCGTCHVAPSYTSAKTYDVGSGQDADGAFNPPSLRGVSQGGPYFHDGRAATLQEVFTRHRHQLQAELPQGDLNDLLAFLEAL